MSYRGRFFSRSSDPTDSVKALKEVVVLRIGFNPTRSTSPCYNPTQRLVTVVLLFLGAVYKLTYLLTYLLACMQYTVIHIIHT